MKSEPRVKRQFKYLFEKNMERELDNLTEGINGQEVDITELKRINKELIKRIETLENGNQGSQ
jgi:hypothetical protein